MCRLVLAPDQALIGALDDDLDDNLHTRGMIAERIATGYEMLGLRLALEDAGADREVVENILGTISKRKQAKAAETIQFLNSMRRNGVSVSDLEDASIELYSILKGRQDLQDILPEFQLRTYGYSTPLTQEELQKYIASFSDEEDIKSS